eukprot:jgi/Galph1/1566/GphlegSOOS_G243.1
MIHEQAAAHAADAYARSTGKVGVCFATSGPGATNLVTGIATAQMDSIPILVITGQVALPFIGTDAFQETDIFGITLPIVKHSYVVRNPRDMSRIVAEAFYIAKHGRPGPVLIDIPKDITLENFIIFLMNLMKLIYLVADLFHRFLFRDKSFSRISAIPVTTTLMGKGIIEDTHPLSLGMLGARFDDRVTGKLDEFASKLKLYMLISIPQK